MTVNYAKHKNILLQILKDIYSDTSISPHLGFKGGTAAHLFYGLILIWILICWMKANSKRCLIKFKK